MRKLYLRHIEERGEAGLLAAEAGVEVVHHKPRISARHITTDYLYLFIYLF